MEVRERKTKDGRVFYGRRGSERMKEGREKDTKVKRGRRNWRYY